VADAASGGSNGHYRVHRNQPPVTVTVQDEQGKINDGSHTGREVRAQEDVLDTAHDDSPGTGVPSIAREADFLAAGAFSTGASSMTGSAALGWEFMPVTIAGRVLGAHRPDSPFPRPCFWPA
jgi:hypothetical protein